MSSPHNHSHSKVMNHGRVGQPGSGCVLIDNIRLEESGLKINQLSTNVKAMHVYPKASIIIWKNREREPPSDLCLRAN